MFSRKVQYEAGAETTTLDDLSRKLAVDLRKHVRKLDSYDTFSKDWLNMIDSLLHISNIAMMEHRLPRDNEDATLWEGDELTVRFLLEEGKLNLCLRLMHEFKKQMAAAPPDMLDQLVTQLAVEKMDKKVLEQRILVFEQSLGVLLKCAFEHVEAIQTTDLPELITHITEVLQGASKKASADIEFERTQESACLGYLVSIMKRIEDLTEDRIMPLFKEQNTIGLTVNHLLLHKDALKPEDQQSGLMFLALVFDSEDFSTHASKYFPDPDAKGNLCKLKPLLEGFIQDLDVKRKLRPLTDVMTKYGA